MVALLVRGTSYNLTTWINSSGIANVWKKDHCFVPFLGNNCKFFIYLLDLLGEILESLRWRVSSLSRHSPGVFSPGLKVGHCLEKEGKFLCNRGRGWVHSFFSVPTHPNAYVKTTSMHALLVSVDEVATHNKKQVYSSPAPSEQVFARGHATSTQVLRWLMGHCWKPIPPPN